MTQHNPVWSHDERILSFEVVDEAGIYRLSLSDQAVERVAGLRGSWTSHLDTCSVEGVRPDASTLIAYFRDDRDITRWSG